MVRLRRRTAALMCMCALTLGPEPAIALAEQPAGVSTVQSTEPAPPTSTKHSYDDADQTGGVRYSGPTPWILGGALAGLIGIGVILMRANRASGPPNHR